MGTKGKAVRVLKPVKLHSRGNGIELTDNIDTGLQDMDLDRQGMKPTGLDLQSGRAQVVLSDVGRSVVIGCRRNGD